MYGIDVKKYDESEMTLINKIINKFVTYYRTFGSTAADLRQAGWVGYLKGVKTFEFGRSSFTFWVINYICWEMCNTLNIETKNKHVKSYETLSDTIEVEEDFADDTIEKVAVLAAVEQLSERQKKLLENRFANNLTQSETAVILGVSQGAISNEERQTLAILRSIMSGKGEKRKDLIPNLKGGKLKHVN